MPADFRHFWRRFARRIGGGNLDKMGDCGVIHNEIKREIVFRVPLLYIYKKERRNPKKKNVSFL